jgi:hypothetical protein
MRDMQRSSIHGPVCDPDGPRGHVSDERPTPGGITGTVVDLIGALHHHPLNVSIQGDEPVLLNVVGYSVDGVAVTERAT